MSNEKIKIKCHLCDTDADQYDSPERCIKIVECPHCVNKYEITLEALLYFDGKQNYKVLTKEERYGFSKLVQSQSITITAKLIAEKTGR